MNQTKTLWPINLTPHDVTIVNERGEIVSWLPAMPGREARARSDRQPVGHVDMPSYHGEMGEPLLPVAIFAVEFGEVDGLPDPSRASSTSSAGLPPRPLARTVGRPTTY